MWRRGASHGRAARRDGRDTVRADAGGAPPPEQRVLLAALRHLVGSARGVVYDVPLAERPVGRPGSVRLHGSPSWSRFLDARERLDGGELSVVIALRALTDDEAALVVDWGSTYANTFLLVEPADPRCDLTAPDDRCAVRVRAAALGMLRGAAAPDGDAAADGQAYDAWLDASPLVVLLRELFGRWVSWDAPPPSGTLRRLPLELSRPGETLAELLVAELHRRFAQDAYDRELARLLIRERELLWGPVTRARSVFRTRLGLPVLLDAGAADRAVRHLVNRGRMTVFDPAHPRARPFGAGHPVPDEMSDEQFASLVVA